MDPLELQLHDAALQRLHAAAGRVTIYDSDVPTNPPVDGQRFVLPYVVLWASPASPTQRSIATTPNGWRWTVQATCAGGAPDRAIHACRVARHALEGAVLLPGVGKLMEVPNGQPFRRDTTTTPPRWYVPLQFTCLATPIEGDS